MLRRDTEGLPPVLVGNPDGEFRAVFTPLEDYLPCGIEHDGVPCGNPAKLRLDVSEPPDNDAIYYLPVCIDCLNMGRSDA